MVRPVPPKLDVQSQHDDDVPLPPMMTTGRDAESAIMLVDSSDEDQRDFGTSTAISNNSDPRLKRETNHRDQCEDMDMSVESDASERLRANANPVSSGDAENFLLVDRPIEPKRTGRALSLPVKPLLGEVTAGIKPSSIVDRVPSVTSSSSASKDHHQEDESTLILEAMLLDRLDAQITAQEETELLERMDRNIVKAEETELLGRLWKSIDLAAKKEASYGERVSNMEITGKESIQPDPWMDGPRNEVPMLAEPSRGTHFSDVSSILIYSTTKLVTKRVEKSWIPVASDIEFQHSVVEKLRRAQRELCHGLSAHLRDVSDDPMSYLLTASGSKPALKLLERLADIWIDERTKMSQLFQLLYDPESLVIDIFMDPLKPIGADVSDYPDSEESDVVEGCWVESVSSSGQLGAVVKSIENTGGIAIMKIGKSLPLRSASDIQQARAACKKKRVLVRVCMSRHAKLELMDQTKFKKSPDQEFPVRRGKRNRVVKRAMSLNKIAADIAKRELSNVAAVPPVATAPALIRPPTDTFDEARVELNTIIKDKNSILVDVVAKTSTSLGLSLSDLSPDAAANNRPHEGLWIKSFKQGGQFWDILGANACANGAGLVAAGGQPVPQVEEFCKLLKHLSRNPSSTIRLRLAFFDGTDLRGLDYAKLVPAKPDKPNPRRADGRAYECPITFMTPPIRARGETSTEKPKQPMKPTEKPKQTAKSPERRKQSTKPKEKQKRPKSKEIQKKRTSDDKIQKRPSETLSKSSKGPTDSPEPSLSRIFSKKYKPKPSKSNGATASPRASSPGSSSVSSPSSRNLKRKRSLASAPIMPNVTGEASKPPRKKQNTDMNDSDDSDELMERARMALKKFDQTIQKRAEMALKNIDLNDSNHFGDSNASKRTEIAQDKSSAKRPREEQSGPRPGAIPKKKRASLRDILGSNPSSSSDSPKQTKYTIQRKQTSGAGSNQPTRSNYYEISVDVRRPLGAFFVSKSGHKGSDVYGMRTCMVHSVDPKGQLGQDRRIRRGAMVVFAGDNERLDGHDGLVARYNSARLTGKGGFKLTLDNTGVGALAMPSPGFHASEWSSAGNWQGGAIHGWAGGASDVSTPVQQKQIARQKLNEVNRTVASSQSTNKPAAAAAAAPKTSVRNLVLPQQPFAQHRQSAKPKPPEPVHLGFSTYSDLRPLLPSTHKPKSILRKEGESKPKRSIKFPCDKLVEEREFFKGSAPNDRVIFDQPASTPVITQVLPFKSVFEALRDAIERKSSDETVTLLNQLALSTENISIEELERLYNYTKELIEAEKGVKSIRLSELKKKKMMLNIYLNTSVAITYSTAMKTWKSCEFRVRSISVRYQRRLEETHGKSHVLSGVVGYLSGTAVTRSDTKLGPIPSRPVAESIFYADEEENPSFHVNNNAHILHEDRVISVALFEGLDSDSVRPTYLGRFMIPLNQLEKAAENNCSWNSIESTTLAATDVFKSGTIEIDFRMMKLPEGQANQNLKDSLHKLATQVSNIKRFNADQEKDRSVPLSANIIGPDRSTPLHAAINLRSLELVRSLVKLGADPLLRSDKETAMSMVRSFAERIKMKQNQLKKAKGDENMVTGNVFKDMLAFLRKAESKEFEGRFALDPNRDNRPPNIAASAIGRQLPPPTQAQQWTPQPPKAQQWAPPPPVAQQQAAPVPAPPAQQWAAALPPPVDMVHAAAPLPSSIPDDATIVRAAVSKLTKDTQPDGTVNKGLVGGMLRTAFPNIFPKIFPVKKFLERVITAGILIESGIGAFKRVRLGPGAYR